MDPQDPHEEEAMLTPKQAAERLGVTTRTLLGWAGSGRIRAVVRGGQRYYPKYEVERIREEEGGLSGATGMDQ